MMFQADTAFAAELIALVLGTALLVWSAKNEACCKAFAKIVAYFTIVAAVLTMLCTGYYTVRYWEDGYFRNPSSRGCMHGKGRMMDYPMMKQMMKKMEKKSMGTGAPADDHEQHH